MKAPLLVLEEWSVAMIQMDLRMEDSIFLTVPRKRNQDRGLSPVPLQEQETKLTLNPLTTPPNLPHAHPFMKDKMPLSLLENLHKIDRCDGSKTRCNGHFTDRH
jgi:hypothetical protein